MQWAVGVDGDGTMHLTRAAQLLVVCSEQWWHISGHAVIVA
jgi:hypothetical protein